MKTMITFCAAMTTILGCCTMTMKTADTIESRCQSTLIKQCYEEVYPEEVVSQPYWQNEDMDDLMSRLENEATN